MLLEVRIILLSLLQKGDVRFGHQVRVEQSLWGCQKRPQQKSKEAINGHELTVCK